jgi:hypothetical protein
MWVMGRDARPYAPDNFDAVTHGARSPRRVGPRAEALARDLVSVAPWCAQPAFRAAVASWAQAEAQCVLLRGYVDEHGMLGAGGVPLPACALLERVEGRAARLRGELGLSPNAWAKLVARLGSADHDAAARGLDQLKAVGRELARTAALPDGSS